MIHLQRLDKQALIAFVESEKCRMLPDLPISPLRAVSQCHNPRLQAGDVLLYMAWAGDRLAGYLGVLPDAYYTPDGSRVRCGWLSCLWVTPACRGQSIAGQLVSGAVEDMQGQILLTEYAQESRRVYEKLGNFSEMSTQTGIRLYYRFDLQHILPPKKPFFRKIKSVLRLADRLGNLPVDLFRYIMPVKTPASAWEYLNVVDGETADFIAQQSGQELFRRGAEELTWALTFPWLREGREDEQSKRYYFSWIDNPVDFVPIRLRDRQGATGAFFVLMRRGRTMKMPACYLLPGMEKAVAEVIDLHRSSWGVNTFSTFHPEMTRYYQTCRTFALHKKELKRHYLAANAMAERLKGVDFRVQDGDGDVFFT